MSSRSARPRRATRAAGRIVVALAVASVFAAIGRASDSSSPAASAALTGSAHFNPAFAPAPPAQSSGGNRSQPGESWQGTAPPPDPLGTTGSADVHEFQVLSGFDNDALTVTISWSAGPALSYDLDLFVQRLDQFGSWVEVARSTDGQALGDGEALETAVVGSPPPGTYRARVVNFASTELAYAGSIGFSVVKGRAPKPTSGRATEDRPDAALGPQLHAIYFVPSDGVDEALDTNGVIENAVTAMNLWYEGQTGGRHKRLDTFADRRSTRLDISFVRGNQTTAEYAESDAFRAITDELEARGWTASPALKRYLVYYAGPAEDSNVCGTAFLPLNPNDFAQWSVVFLDASPGCGARDFGTPATGAGMSEAIAVQELEHNEAMAPLTAPHQCWAFNFHICTAAAGAVLETLDPESVDALFPFVTVPLRDKVLDRDRDDYFEHPFAHRDLTDSPFWEG